MLGDNDEVRVLCYELDVNIIAKVVTLCVRRFQRAGIDPETPGKVGDSSL